MRNFRASGTRDLPPADSPQLFDSRPPGSTRLFMIAVLPDGVDVRPGLVLLKSRHRRLFRVGRVSMVSVGTQDLPGVGFPSSVDPASTLG
jgi:hypothetical protein